MFFTNPALGLDAGCRPSLASDSAERQPKTRKSAAQDGRAVSTPTDNQRPSPAQQHEADRIGTPDAMAFIPPSAFEISPSSRPRWQQRAQQREQYLSSSLAGGIPTSRSVSAAEARPHQDGFELQQRHLISASTSPHSENNINAATPTHTTSITASTDISPHVNMESPLAGSHLRPSTSCTSTFSTSDSWLTCSEVDSNRANNMDPGISIGRFAPEISNNEPLQINKEKKQAFKAMLSAIDRKRAKNLPKEQSPLQASQGNVLPPSLYRRCLTHISQRLPWRA